MNMNENVLKDDRRILYLDLVKVTAAISVIIIHIFAPIITFYNDNLSQTQMIVFKSLRYFCNWAVPCFVMVTGALLLKSNKEINYKLMFSKYIPRILYALLIFGFLYAWMEIIFNEKQINIYQIKTVFYNIMTNKLWDHMWYLYMLLGLYLIIPILKLFVNHSKEGDYLIALFILFASNSILPLISRIFNISFGIQIQTASIYVFFLLLGNYFSERRSIPIKASFLLIGLPSLILFLFASNIFKLSNFDNEFTYSSPMIVLIAIGLFTLMMNYSGKSKLVTTLGNLSFTIYLIHPLFINIILKLLKINPSRYPVLIVIVVMLIAVPIASVFFSYLLCKIRILKKYVL